MCETRCIVGRPQGPDRQLNVVALGVVQRLIAHFGHLCGPVERARDFRHSDQHTADPIASGHSMGWKAAISSC
jgi:hypothetical protein